MRQGFGTLLLAAAEAVCVFAVGAAKAGFVLASASLAASGWATILHRDGIRIPVLLLAVGGAMLNLGLLWRSQRLRNAPAAAWRKRPRTARELRRIGFVVAFSLVTLGLAITEMVLHHILHHTVI